MSIHDDDMPGDELIEEVTAKLREVLAPYAGMERKHELAAVVAIMEMAMELALDFFGEAGRRRLIEAMLAAEKVETLLEEIQRRFTNGNNHQEDHG